MTAEVGTPMNRRGVAGFQDPQSLQDMSKQNKCQKLTQIGNWQRALREFMQSDARLSDLVSLYGQKFVQLGENKNFTLSTLTDMVWTVLVLTWEAILDNKLPLVGEADAGYYKRYQDLNERFKQCRTEWLKEVSNLRDQKRSNKWNDGMQAAYDMSMDHDIFTFVPENALDEDTREYFKLSMQENMKMALVKGAAAAGEQTQLLAEKLQKVEEELIDAKNQLDQQEGEILKLQGELFEAQEESKAAGKGKSKEVVKVERVESKSSSEVNQLRQDKEALETKLNKILEKLRALGFEGDIDSLDDGAFEEIKRRLSEHGSAGSPQKGRAGGMVSVDPEVVKAGQKAEEETVKLRQLLAEAEERARKVEQERDQARNEVVETKKQAQLLEKEVHMTKKKVEEAEKGTKGAKEKATKQAEAEEEKRRIEEEKRMEKERKSAKADKGGGKEHKVPTRSIGVGDHSVLEEKKSSGGKEIVYVEKVVEVEKPTGEIPASAEAAIAAEVERRLQTQKAEMEKEAEVRQALKERKAMEKKEKEEEEKAAEEVRQRRKEEEKQRRASAAAMESADGARSDAEAYGRSMEKKNARLETQLEETKENEEKLKRKVAKMNDEINEARDVRKKLEMSLAELNKKFQDLKYQLMDRGIDTAVIEEAMNDCGLEKIISGPVINVFDRLYHDAMKRSTRVSVVKEKLPGPPDRRSLWNAKRRTLIRNSTDILADRGNSDESESGSEASIGMNEAYGSSGRPRRKSLSEMPHLNGGKVLVRELGSAQGYTVKATTAFLWAQPDLGAPRMYKGNQGTEVIGVPYEVGGVRWLLVHSLRPKDWSPADGADDVPHGACWALIDGGPLEIAHDIMVPMRVTSATKAEPLPVGVSDEQSPYSTIKMWTPTGEQLPPSSGLSKFQRKTWAMAHILGATKGSKKGNSAQSSGSAAGRPDNFSGRQGVVSINEQAGIDEFGNIDHPVRSRSGSPSGSRSESRSGSRSGSASKNSGSRPASRERYPPGRSPSPIAHRAAEATRMFTEAQEIAGRAGTADSSQPSGKQGLLRPTVINQTLGEDDTEWIPQQGWPYRSPRRSMAAGFYTNLDESELSVLDENSQERPASREGQRASSPSLRQDGSLQSPRSRPKRALSPNSEALAQHIDAYGDASRPGSQDGQRVMPSDRRHGSPVREHLAGGSQDVAYQPSGGRQGRMGSPARDSVAGVTYDAARRTASPGSPSRAAIFNFTELEQESGPRYTPMGRVPVRRPADGANDIAGDPRGQAQRKSQWRTLEGSPSQRNRNLNLLNLELGQGDPSVSIQSHQSQSSVKPRSTAAQASGGQAGREWTPTANDLLGSAQAHQRGQVGGSQSSQGADFRVGDLDYESQQRDTKAGSQSHQAQSVARASMAQAIASDLGVGTYLPAVQGSGQATGSRKHGRAERGAAPESPERTSEGARRRDPSTGSLTGSSRKRPGPGAAAEFSQTAPAGLSISASRPVSRGQTTPGGLPVDAARPSSRGSEVYDIVSRQPPTALAQGSSHWRRPGERSSMQDGTQTLQVAGAAELPLQRRLSNGVTLPQGRYLGGRSSESGLVGSASAPSLLPAGSSGSASLNASGVAEVSLADDFEGPNHLSHLSQASSTTYIHAASSGVPAAGCASCRIAPTGDPLALVEMAKSQSDVKFLPQLPTNSPPGSLRQMGGPKMTGKIFTGSHRVEQMRESQAVAKANRKLVEQGQAPTSFVRGRDPSTRKLFLMKGERAPEPSGRQLAPGTPPG